MFLHLQMSEQGPKAETLRLPTKPATQHADKTKKPTVSQFNRPFSFLPETSRDLDSLECEKDPCDEFNSFSL